MSQAGFYLRPGKNGVSPMAFSNELICPHCMAKKWKFVTVVNQFYLRYLCKACKNTILYDVSNRPEHPYTPYKKNNFFRDLIERSKGMTGKTHSPVQAKA